MTHIMPTAVRSLLVPVVSCFGRQVVSGKLAPKHDSEKVMGYAQLFATAYFGSS